MLLNENLGKQRRTTGSIMVDIFLPEDLFQTTNDRRHQRFLWLKKRVVVGEGQNTAIVIH